MYLVLLSVVHGSSLLGFCCRLLCQPLSVGLDESAQSVGFHLFVEDDVVAEFEQVLCVEASVVEEVTYRELQTVQVVLRNIACGVDKLLEKVVFVDNLEDVVVDIEMTCPTFVELNIVHGYGW